MFNILVVVKFYFFMILIKLSCVNCLPKDQNGIPRKATSAKVCKLKLESDDVGPIKR